MRPLRGPFTAVVLGALWLATLTSPARAAAKYDYDPSVDFTKYKTFRWLGDAAVAPPRSRARLDPHGQLSPLVEKQIGEAVKTQLQGKGLEYKEQGPPDLAVAIHTGKQREIVGYGWGPRYVGPRRVEVNEEGTLTIDLLDREKRELVWRGSIAAEIKDDPEKLHQQIDTLVEKVLKNYPPPKK